MTRIRPVFSIHTSLLFSWLIIVVLGLSMAAAAFADSASWRRNSNGTWTTDSNWTGIDPQALTDIATFGSITLTANRTVTLDANRSIAALVFTTNNFGYTIAGPNTLTLNNPVGITQNGSGANTINTALTLATNQTWGGTGTGQINIGGVISGNTSITKTGTFTLALSGANSFTGAVNINAGVLRLSNNNALGTSTWGNTIANGAALELQGGITVNEGSFAVAGNGGGTGAVRNVSGNNTLGGQINLTGATTIGSAAGTLTLSGAVDVAQDLTITGAGNTNFSGTLNGSANFIKNSTGSITLSGATGNNLSGTTTVNQGTLILAKTSGNAIVSALVIGDGTNAATVQLGAANQIADYNGTPITINQGSTLNLNNFNEAIYNLNMTGGSVTTGAGTLTLANTGSGAITTNASSVSSSITGKLGLAAYDHIITVANGSAATDLNISAVISGSGTTNITKEGTGTLSLSGANTYTGATAINAGTLRIESNGALGTAANTANTTVATGAVLQLANNITTTNGGTLILNGNGTGAGSGALHNVSGNNSWDSAISLGSDATIYSGTAGNTLYLNSNYVSAHTLSLGSNTLTIDGPGDTWVNANMGVAGDTGGLIKNGSGKLTLYGYNTFYTGATNVNAGSLDLIVGPFNTGVYGIMGSLTIGTGSGAAGSVNVNIATNSYANQISPTSAVTINSDGALNVGASTGMGALTLNGGQLNITTGKAISPTSITSNANSAHQTSLISGGQVTLSGATNFTVARDATLTSDLTVSSTIAGGSMVKQGDGVLTLTSTNTINGTTINAGVINARANNALGTTNSVTVAGGAALQTQGGISLGHTTTTINGSGVSNTGAIHNISGNNTLTGAVSLGSASRINSDAGTLTLAGGLNTASNSLIIGGTGNTTLSGTLSFGSGSLIKVDAGTLTLNSNLDLSSSTLALYGGTLALNGINLSVDTFNVGSSSVIDFGGTASILNVNSLSIATGAILTITGWTNSVDYFYSLLNPGTTNLSQIVFTTFSGSDTHWQSWDKQVTPVPEPSTYGLLLMGAGLSFYLWRRRGTAKGN